MSAVAERGGQNVSTTSPDALDNVTRSVGLNLADKLVPAWQQMGHGIAILSTSDILEQPEGLRYVDHIQEGFSRVVETVTSLAKKTMPGTPTSVPLQEGVDVIVGELAAGFVEDFGHRVHTPNTLVRGFAQLAARKTTDHRAVQAAGLIIAGADKIEEETGKFRRPQQVTPPKQNEPPKIQQFIDRVVAERHDGEIFVDIVLGEKLVEPEAA